MFLGLNKAKKYLYIAIAVVLFFAVNVIGFISFNQYRVDVTENNVFSLSDGSKKILDGVQDKIKLRLFYSSKAANGIPVIKSYATRITGLLEQYVSNSHGNISLEIIHPEQFTDDEDLAVAYGIKGFDLGDGKGTKLYFGLAATNSVDKTSVIPFFDLQKEKFIEYDLTRIISNLTTSKREKVAVLSTIQVESPGFMGISQLGGGSGWVFLEQIKESFNVTNLPETVETIPSDTNLLILIQPRGLNNMTLAAVEQFILKGGRALIFADPNKEGPGTGNPDERTFSLNFNELLNAWGVNIPEDKVVGDRMAARKKEDKDSAFGSVDSIVSLTFRKNNFNSDDVITNGLNILNIDSPGYIETLDKSATNIIPLIKTSSQSTRIDADKIRLSPDVNKLLREFVPDNKEYVIAARINGDAKAVYSNLLNSPDYTDRSTQPINVVLVADTDMLRDNLWVNKQNYEGYTLLMPLAENGSFVMNAVENMVGDNALISLRARGSLDKPFTVVEEIRKNAEKNYLSSQDELQKRLDETEKRLADMQAQAQQEAGNDLMIRQAQQDEIARFGEEMVRIRKELRNVQHELTKDIEALGSLLKFINIGLIPIIVTLLAFGIFFIKKRRRG